VPEGDTVWNTARTLHRALAGGVLTASDFRVPQLATQQLADWTVLESASRGKHLLLRLRDANGECRFTLHSHLRMDGAWRVYAPGARWAARPAHHIRVVLRTHTAVAVGYHLHDLALVPTADEDRLVGHLGPDLLGADWDETEAVRRIAAHPGTSIAEALLDQRNLAGVDSELATVPPTSSELVQRGYWVEAEAVRRLATQPARPIGEALLDQRNLAGLGTIYTDEVLFLVGVSPLATVGQVRDPLAVVRLARRLLLANRGRPAQVTTGDARPGRGLWVHGRQGQPCRRCGTQIMKGLHGSEPLARLAYWCPSCQPSASG
jgi:endonuclease VIII